MIGSKFNLIKASEAKEIVKNEYPKKIYLDYMRTLNNLIYKYSEQKGWTSMLHIAPLDIISDKVYRELKAAGYKIELFNDGKELKISWD